MFYNKYSLISIIYLSIQKIAQCPFSINRKIKDNSTAYFSIHSFCDRKSDNSKNLKKLYSNKALRKKVPHI